ncbi:MAG: helix-turn-helix transcriptional regulator [Rhizobacter sp.]|nr:helix-turn-helix transcriptional regulator [Bacteriovorax sp.]
MAKKVKSKRDSKKIRETLGSFIKENRLEKNYSQAELAAALGYSSPQFISDWERGVSSPPLKKLPELANELDVKMEKLFDLLLELATTQLTTNLKEEYKKIS